MKPENEAKLKILIASEQFFATKTAMTEEEQQARMNKRLLYLKMLTDVMPEELALAMRKIVRQQTFWPSVAEILAAVESIRDTVNPELHVPTADEAWREVMQQVRDCYPYKTATFSTPEIRKAVNCIGFAVIAETPLSSLNITYAQFRDTYNNMLRRKKSEEENLTLLAAMPESIALRIAANHKKMNNRQLLAKLLLPLDELAGDIKSMNK